MMTKSQSLWFIITCSLNAWVDPPSSGGLSKCFIKGLSIYLAKQEKHSAAIWELAFLPNFNFILNIEYELSKSIKSLQESEDSLISSFSKFAFLFPPDLLYCIGLDPKADYRIIWGVEKGPSCLEDVYDQNEKLFDFTDAPLHAITFFKNTDKCFWDLDQMI